MVKERGTLFGIKNGSRAMADYWLRIVVNTKTSASPIPFASCRKQRGGGGAAAPRGVEDERLINKIGPGLTPPYIFEHPEAPGTLERRARLFRLAGVCLAFFVLMHRGGGGYSSWTSGLSLFYPSNGFLGWVGQKFVCRSKEIWKLKWFSCLFFYIRNWVIR